MMPDYLKTAIDECIAKGENYYPVFSGYASFALWDLAHSFQFENLYSREDLQKRAEEARDTLAEMQTYAEQARAKHQLHPVFADICDSIVRKPEVAA